MKIIILFSFLLLSSTLKSEEKPIPQPSKAETEQVEQSAHQTNPAFNLNFTVATSNGQDARAQNTTNTSATQATIQPAAAPQPQIIIVRHEHQQESMARGIFFTLLSASLHAGVAILTGGKTSAPTPAKAAILSLPTRSVMAPDKMHRMLELIKKR